MELTPFEEHKMLLQNYALEINELKANGKTTIDINKYIELLGNYIDLNRQVEAQHNRLKEVGKLLNKASQLK